MLDAAETLLEQDPELSFVLPLAPSLDEEALAAFSKLDTLPVTVIQSDSHVVAMACDCVAVASGTATLELALLKVPMVVVYKLNPINYAIMRRLIKIPHISLVNIVAEQEVCIELVQGKATAAAISQELQRLLSNEAHRDAQLNAFAQIAEKMGEPGASQRVAAIIKSLLPDKSPT